jgi:hypothetical protein
LEYPLEEPAEVEYVRTETAAYISTIKKAVRGKLDSRTVSSGSSERQLPTDRLRYILAICLFPEIRDAYERSQNTKTRQELDAERSADVSTLDFHDLIVEKFNDVTWDPETECLGELHSDFAQPIRCPKRENYTMTKERSKALLTKMRGDLQDICRRYNQSGNGSNRADIDEEGNYTESFGHFDANAPEVVERGDDRHNFLHNQPTDLLYWWDALDKMQLIHFTTAKLRGPCAISSQGGGSKVALTSGGSAKKKRKDDYEETSILSDSMVEGFGGLSDGIKEMNHLTRKKHKLSVQKHEQSFLNEIEALREKKFEVECRMAECSNERLMTVFEKRISELNKEIDEKLLALNEMRMETIIDEDKED